MNCKKDSRFKHLLRSIGDEFTHHPLGSVYYIFAILALGFGVVKWLIISYGPGNTSNTFQYWLIAIEVGIALIIPYLAIQVLRTRNTVVSALNPSLASLNTEFELTIYKTKRMVVRKDKLKAISPTKVLIYRFRPTGSVALSASLLEPATAKLAGPVFQYDSILYQIEFDEELTAGQIVDVCLNYQVDDPTASMKPFHSLFAGNLQSYSRISHILRFPDDHPKSVVFEVSDAQDPAIVGSIKTLFPQKNGDYKHCFNNTPTAIYYAFSWSW